MLNVGQAWVKRGPNDPALLFEKYSGEFEGQGPSFGILSQKRAASRTKRLAAAAAQLLHRAETTRRCSPWKW